MFGCRLLDEVCAKLAHRQHSLSLNSNSRNGDKWYGMVKIFFLCVHKKTIFNHFAVASLPVS